MLAVQAVTCALFSGCAIPPLVSAFDPLRTLEALRQKSLMTRWILVIIAAAIGVAVPAISSLLYSILAQRPLELARDVDLEIVLVVAAPYLLLGMVGVRKVLPWAVALSLTLSLWAYSLQSSVSYRWHPDGSGVDLLTGFLILSSFLWITFAAFAVHAVQQYVSTRE